MRNYRGKRIDNGKFVEGYLVEQNNPEYHAYIIEEFKAEMDNLHMDILACYMEEVDPETVGQCTGVFGLFHWQGDVEHGMILRSFIYEGDIVEPVQTLGTYEGFSWGRQVVVFDRGAFCLKDSRGNTTPLRSYSVNVEFKVWGNVHDNADLLEVTE